MTAATERPWAEIARRVGEAKGPDRDLDAAVFRALGYEVWSYHDNCHIDAQITNGIYAGRREDHVDFYPEGDLDLTWRWRFGEGRDAKYGELCQVTASVDTILSLIAEKLPGWGFMLRQHDTYRGFRACCSLLAPPTGSGSETFDIWAATPALSLLATFALAMDAQPLPAPASTGGREPVTLAAGETP